MTISELVKQAHENATDKGWYDEPKTFGELIALCHSELSEALEDYRQGKGIGAVRFSGADEKPEGIPIELADVVIRVADMCGYYGIDLEAAIKLKMEYNKTRPYKPCASCKYAVEDITTKGSGWVGIECGNSNSEYHRAILNVGRDGSRSNRVTWTGCEHHRLKGLVARDESIFKQSI